MLSLGPMQRALASLYRLDLPWDVDHFVRPLDPGDEHAARGEVVLVREDDDGVSVRVLLDPRVPGALAGDADSELSRFAAWCLALEGVSHFVLLAHRAANDRPVSQLELELQAEVDKFAVGLLQRALHRGPEESARASRALRLALFERTRFLDAPDTPRGRRYRLAHRLAARYAASLERRYVRDARLGVLVEELRDFYRSGLATKWSMAEAA